MTLIPYPFASVSLLLLWLLLNQSLSPAHLLWGCTVALAGGWALAALDLPKLSLRRLSAIIGLAGLVVTDIVASNIAVAGIIFRPERRDRTSGFVKIPLELQNPYGLATLACIITSPPGTLWVDFDAATGALTIHVLDLIDENQWVRTIKGRYEQHLLEIFA